MSRFFLAASIMLSFVHNAQADEASNRLCEKLSSMAKSIMSARQGGVEMSKIINAFDKIANEELRDKVAGSVGDVAKEYAARAYGFPRMYSKGLKAETVAEFGNTMYWECYDVFKK